MRRQAFVQALANPTSPTFGNQAQSAIAAGYSPDRARVTGSELVANSNVASAIQAVRSDAIASFRSQGITPEFLAGELFKAMADDDRKVRPSKVRALELGMKVEGWLGADTEVSIDARSILLPGLQQASASDLESLLSTFPEPESEAT